MVDRKFVIQGKTGTVSGPEESPFIQHLLENSPESEVATNIDIGTFEFILDILKIKIDEYSIFKS